MERSLISWNWKELQDTYIVFAQQFAECQRIARTFEFKLPLEREIKELSKMPSDRAHVVSKLFLDVKRISTHLSVLEREIERRRGLIGVL